jgi:transcriptional regulator with XRE-family HTH domain
MGLWLRTMRERHNKTQEELLADFKREYKPVAKSTLSTWENETANAPIHDNLFIEAVARIFNVSVADVLKGSGYDLGPAYQNELDEQRRILLEAFDSGDLAKLVRIALEAHDKRGQLYSRLESKDTDTSEGEGSTATTSGRR